VLVDEGQRAKLSIEDTGIGMSADELTHIFKRFYRCDRSRSRQGNGLGLSLALAFVRAHGGNITVKSTLGQGSTFTVVLTRTHYGRKSQSQAAIKRPEREREDLAASETAVS
jgi:signal transduction histidine kinase